MTASAPLTLVVAELLRRPGTRRHEHLEVELDGLAISASRVDAGTTIDVDVIVESLSSSIVVAGRVRASWVGECRRCLGEARGVAEAEVREVFEPHPTEGETYPLAGDHIDLEPLVRDAVLLSLPLAPLCSPECQGPAPDSVGVGIAGAASPAGGPDADRDADDPADRSRPGDPRWAALDELRFE